MRISDWSSDVCSSDLAPVRISAYGHKSWQGQLPVGKGVIRVKGKRAILEGQFFMTTTHGRDTFETVKALSEDGLQEWSYEVGRAACREGVCQTVKMQGVAAAL